MLKNILIILFLNVMKHTLNPIFTKFNKIRQTIGGIQVSMQFFGSQYVQDISDLTMADLIKSI